MSTIISLKDRLSVKRRKERIKMRICYDMQREVIRLRDETRHWHDLLLFYSEWRARERSEMQVDIAGLFHVYWDEKFNNHWHKFVVEITKLKSLTAKRRKLQDQLGMAPTADEYIDHGPRAERGKRFVLLEHELDSTTSVQHYVEESLSGSSLFIFER
ncbi:hypothetical protein PTMSG1_01602 [Pyrenophora teres f. maculata]|nr:hypothetical protein PTMSG1_01602 [Pyrenophora teres f. maculata]